LEEDHAVVRHRRAGPAERLVEAARPIEIGDAESDEAHALVHGFVLRWLWDWSGDGDRWR
jgi:hypothetical protein